MFSNLIRIWYGCQWLIWAPWFFSILLVCWTNPFDRMVIRIVFFNVVLVAWRKPVLEQKWTPFPSFLCPIFPTCDSLFSNDVVSSLYFVSLLFCICCNRFCVGKLQCHFGAILKSDCSKQKVQFEYKSIQNSVSH